MCHTHSNRPRVTAILAAANLIPLLVHGAEVRVESEYGKEKVTPRVGTISVPEEESEQTFDAPEFVYLNRDFEELDAIGSVNDPDESKVAFYRARNVGYAINGELVQGAERFFKETIKEDTTIVWKWELDYAVFVDFSDKDGQALSQEIGDAIGNPDPSVGRTWVPKDTEFAASVDRTVSADASGHRYVAAKYKLEHVRGQPLGFDSDHYWKFREVTGGGFNRHMEEFLEERDGLTLAWWGKIDRRLDSKRDEIFMAVTGGTAGSVFIRRLGETYALNTMRIGVRADGQFFVEELNPTTPGGEPVIDFRKLASVPSALVGFEWHHWAVVFDFPFTKATLDSESETIAVTFPFADAADLTVGNVTNSSVLRAEEDYIVNADNTITILDTDRTTVGDALLLSNKRKRSIRVYRDGARIFNEDLPPFNPPAILEGDLRTLSVAHASYSDDQGGHFENLEGGLNNISMWLEALQPDSPDSPSISRIVQHLRSPDGKHVSADSADGEIEGIQQITTLDGDGSRFEAENPFFPATARMVLRASRESTLGNTGERVVTEKVTIDDWLRVKWNWSGQIRYRFDAASGDPEIPSTQLNDQAFVRVFNEAGTEVEKTVFNTGPNSDVWIDTGRNVEVGSFYRTFDRCLTLDDFVALPSGDLGILGAEISELLDSTLNDAQGRSRVARIWPVSAAASPSEVHWYYSPTVFRAEVPLGEGFDAMNPDLQLVPALCDGAILRTGEQGPAPQFTPVSDRADGNATGQPARWDQLGKRLFPVHPGSYRLEWPDANDPDTFYKIEIVSGYPTQEVKLSTERERSSGARITPAEAAADPLHRVMGTGRNRVDYLTLPGADGRFPASPRAHYRHLYDSNSERQPPTRLDLSTTDHWNFVEMTFTDRSANAQVDASTDGTPFNSQGTGRSVLFYSYRPNPDEIADGTEPKENFAVRVVSSEPINSIGPDSPANPLGRRGLELGGGVVGVVGANPFQVHPGPNFVLDFWLHTKDLRPGDGPVSVLTTGPGRLEVTLDPSSSTITASYFGLSAQHTLSTESSGWSHFAVHVLEERFFGVNLTLLNFHADGVRAGDGVVTALLPPDASSSFDVAETLGAGSLRFGLGASPASGLFLDQVRLFDNVPGLSLLPEEVRRMRQGRRTTLRDSPAQFHFDFEPVTAEEVYSFDNTIDQGLPVELGPRPSGARLDIQEVATGLDSVLDDAGFGGSGYILNAVSNYNANLYTRDAEVGTWGPIFPVNDMRLYSDRLRRLEIAYYESPYRHDPLSHPNVAWPYRSMAYDEVIYPNFGPNKDKAIYIASRVGSEGVDQNGKLQEVFRAENYSNLSIYNQPDRNLAGYNPNEEHAIAASSNRAALKIKELGEDLPNNPPLAAFALQAHINNVSEAPGQYTSHPWVLIEVDNLETGGPEMAAYQVFTVRPGRLDDLGGLELLDFPRPSDGSLVPGLAYEDAANPEDRFLTIDPEETYDFTYAFSYRVAAGDLLIPPYPLNLVIGNVTMIDAKGGNDSSQLALWKDVNENAWVVSGNGTFYYQYFYPFRGDFYPPHPGTAIGTPVAWLPDEIDGVRTYTGDGESLEPGKVVYDSFWRSGYPKLKRGETLTYQGGEYFNENPGANGLPAVVAMKAAEIVFDNATPDMLIGDDEIDHYSARIIRALDRYEAPFTVKQMADAGFTPAVADKIFIVAERWYLKELPGSLQKRFYFDSLAEKLVFRGYLNDKEGGDPDLTSGPDPINVLEPNVITLQDLKDMKGISKDSSWASAVDVIHKRSQSPMLVREEAEPHNPIEGRFLAGMMESSVVTLRMGLNKELYDANADLSAERKRLRKSGRLQESTKRANLRKKIRARIAEFKKRISALEYEIEEIGTQADSHYAHLDSFGVGSALICNPGLLTALVDGSRYITIAENNRLELNGAPVSLHIIEIIPDRYRGAIKVIEGSDAFSEKITLQHNGEFGANTGDLYYEWWIRDAAPLDVVAQEMQADGTLAETDARGNSLWQEYLPRARVEDDSLTEPEKHLGLHSIVFEGRPDVVLADKLVLMRYRHRSESDWKLVPFEFTDPAAAWRPGSPAPFQWAGAANSPQLQADGSKRYIPQLVMGWVKRILDRINPYEARYTDFFSNESPATYSSQIQIAGAPFAGKVALNPDKNVIENTGLIELYETVLQRARELSIDNSSNPVSTDGINQALLLAATRLAVLYELLAREAYSDAQDSTITVTSDDADLEKVSSFTHAFRGLESDLLHEELALLRGTDFRKSYPVFNRMFWNYTKGLGEAAYNVHYNIYDENTDGFINEDDARALFPQGHGDAWGHLLSALGMHYELLQQPVFSWKSRSELYSLMQNVLEVDYLDEKTFARLAAAKARTGRDIVRGTYRLHYTQDPDGQWHGYTDGADPARAWGVSEWAHRAGQGAYFDWMTAHAVLPDDAGEATPVDHPENLDRIERSAAASEIGEVAAGLYEIQVAMNEANNGFNPLGFESDTITFDLELEFFEDASGGDRRSHFEQIYLRALTAGSNALETLAYAASAENKLRGIADDTEAIIVEALSQDLDYRNRLIEIFGRPYDGTIGFGKVYPEGYEGPDTLLYAYLDRVTIDEIVPRVGENLDETDVSGETVTFDTVHTRAVGMMNNFSLRALYVMGRFGTGRLDDAFESLVGDNLYQFEQEEEIPLTLPYNYASQYGFQAQEDWGQRTSYGRAQRILEEMLLAEIELDQAISEYIGFLQDYENKVQRLASEIDLHGRREGIWVGMHAVRIVFNYLLLQTRAAIGTLEAFRDSVEIIELSGKEAFPRNVIVGVASGGDATGAARAGLHAGFGAVKLGLGIAKTVVEGIAEIGELIRDEALVLLENEEIRLEVISELEGMVEELENLSGADQPMRDGIGIAIQNLELKAQEYRTALAEGFRILREREAFNKVLAASVQRNRYQDMLVRITRNEAMAKYQSAFNHAARYTWLATRAYDYETSLDPGHPAAATQVFDQIVKTRQLGLWSDGEPQVGQGGLAEILRQLSSNFEVLKGQLGINNPQGEAQAISLRHGLFRIAEGNPSSDDRWEDALKARIVPDLMVMPEFRRHCRPFSEPGEGAQPGVVIRFGSHINNGVNFFGNSLVTGDHAYSTANYATKVRGFAVWLKNYDAPGLSATPRAYLVPIGNDYLRTSSDGQPVTRAWSVTEQRIPTPYVINSGNLSAPGFIPSLDGVDGSFGDLRRHGNFRMYHDYGDPSADNSELPLDFRLISRSVWNSQWLLIIPGTGLHVDPLTGLTQFAETISDIELHFTTYSHQGQ